MSSTKVGNVTFTNVLKDVLVLSYMIVICDLFTTIIALPYGTEGNPLAGAIFGLAGMTGMFLVKISYIVFLYLAGTQICRAGYPYVWDRLVKLIFVLYLIIITNNLIVYFKGIGMI